MPVFGDRAFKEVIRVKWGPKGRALIPYDLCPYKKRKRHQRFLSQSAHTETKGRWWHSKMVAILKPGREVSPKINPRGALLVNFQSPRLWDSKCPLFKPPRCVILSWHPKLTDNKDKSPTWGVCYYHRRGNSLKAYQSNNCLNHFVKLPGWA